MRARAARGESAGLLGADEARGACDEPAVAEHARALGPAVILGDSASLFPTSLAAEWKARGLDVRLVTSTRGPERLPSGVPVIASRAFQPLAAELALGAAGPALALVERLGERLARARYRERTGNARAAEGEWRFARHLRHSHGRARAALAQRPRFVLGHEASSYGLATAWCRGVPRVLFPWGGDVFLYAESSPFVERVVRAALHGVELVVPSAVTAAEHIRRRFALPDEKVVAVSWGVDLERFRPAEGERARAIRAALGIAPDATVVLNARRFLPLWGAFEALEACLRVAARRPDVHCVLLGGAGSEADVRRARERVAAAGLAARFTLFEGNASLEQCADAMAISSLFLSLLGKGDMRSSSVLQAAASGAAPILFEAPEYRAMEREGFAARFVGTRAPDELERALEAELAAPEARARRVAANRAWLERHEDKARQMDRLLALCEGLVAR